MWGSSKALWTGHGLPDGYIYAGRHSLITTTTPKQLFIYTRILSAQHQYLYYRDRPISSNPVIAHITLTIVADRAAPGLAVRSSSDRVVPIASPWRMGGDDLSGSRLCALLIASIASPCDMFGICIDVVSGTRRGMCGAR